MAAELSANVKRALAEAAKALRAEASVPAKGATLATQASLMLVGLLHCDDETTAKDAAVTLGEIASHYKHAICQAGAIPALVALLSDKWWLQGS